MNSFQFKQFSITQQHTAMKVGTDGVLLGAWSDALEGNVLDIGTGTGLIALMLAQRSKTALIDAIELDKVASEQAQENFKSSKWNNRLTVIHSTIQSYQPNKKYDLIISNPPYFINSTKAPNNIRNAARHTDQLSFNDLIYSVKRLLADTGVFSLVLPVEEATLFINSAEKENLFLNRKCLVKPNPTKPVKRILMEFSFIKKDIVLEELTIETKKRHEYTEEYISLTKDFYLKF